ncbi:MAG: S8 family peptidase [Candidatus Sericytochromatia bacterium]|nr:S8 family peptidase [Candidatus Sericytochromatia bacterium]
MSAPAKALAAFAATASPIGRRRAFRENHALRHVQTSCLLALTLALAGCGGATLSSQGAARQASWTTLQAVPGQILVGFQPGRAKRNGPAVARAAGVEMLREIPGIDVAVMRTSGPVKVALEALRAQGGVVFAEPNAVESLPPVRRGEAPSPPAQGQGDPLLGQQWGLAKIGAEAAWQVTPGVPETVVAIVDTGIDYNHPDLTGRVIKGRDFANNDDDPMDGHSHGTHCAGIAGASAANGIGIAGVAPGVTLMAVKVLSDSGSGSTDAVCGGIVWAADHGADVISLSLGGPGGKDAKQAAVDYARAKGAVVVAAMGNNGANVAVYPGASKGAIGVGATTADDTRATFSNFGNWIAVGAPGHQILSTVPDGGYATFSGTSMATPHVAGLAGLVRSASPDLGPDAVATAIQRAAKDLGAAGFDPQFGHGRIDASATLKRR